MGIKIIFQGKSEEDKAIEERTRIKDRKRKIKEGFAKYKIENHTYWDDGFLQMWELDYIKSLGWELITFDAWRYEYIFKRSKIKQSEGENKWLKNK